MMDIREKLVELLYAARCNVISSPIIKYKLFEEADHLLANGVTIGKDIDAPTKWIPVSERLPEKGEQFLCIWEDGRIYDGYRSDLFYGDFLISGFSYVNIHFTHWMPLPQPPKGE